MKREEYAQKLIEDIKDMSITHARLAAYKDALILGLITVQDVWTAEGITETVWESYGAQPFMISQNS